MVATKIRPARDGVELRLWTRAEYERLAESGILTEDDRVELIDGVIYKLTAQKSGHANTVDVAQETLRDAFGRGYRVRVQLPMALGEASEPEPDVAVVAGGRGDFQHAHPSSASLVVEVADATLTYDRRVKAPPYARAGLPEYWVLNLIANQLEVHRDPSPTGYKNVSILKRGDHIAPLAKPDASIAVADLLP
jgi:Uma2 family endonuclease